MKKLFLQVLLGFMGLAFPAGLRAQFIGYTSPQTVTQTLANTVSCTGTPQNFNTANLGQTQHSVFVTWSAQPSNSLVSIQGIDAAGNVIIISDVMQGQVSTTGTTSALNAIGYFPIVRVQVTCATAGAPNFTITYAGSSSSSFLPQGAGLATEVDKNVLVGLTAGSNAGSQPATPPFGNSSGQVVFQYSATGPSGSTIQVECGGSSPTTNIGTGHVQVFTFSLSTTAVQQNFPVPPSPCPFYEVIYNSGGASAVTFNMEYLFTLPGTSVTADPCFQNPKQSQAISAAATATTQIVALNATQAIYVCGFQASQSAAGAFQWEYGTGASCGTGTTVLTGVETTLSGQPVIDGSGSATIFKAPLGNALCVVTSVAGTFNGVLTYVQAQ